MSPDLSLSLCVDSSFLRTAFILPEMKPSPSPATSRQKKAKSRAKSSVAPQVKAADRASIPTAEDDAALRVCLDGIVRQDQAALGRFYDVTVGRVYGVALRIVGRTEMAEEVVSDVYMQVWRDANRYDDTRGKVLGWLLVIARSRALDLLRRQDEAFSHPEPWELATEPSDVRDNPHDMLAATQAGSAVHAAMATLSPLQRQLLSLAFFRGLSHSEIVQHSGIPLGSVKTHIRRALGTLRETLGLNAEFAESEA